jgi:pyruvate kinase
MRRAKIVCTLGPASRSPEVIGQLMDAGLNVARLNFSHGSHEDHARTFKLVREQAERRGVPVAILQDLQGPKIRVRKMRGGSVSLQKGRELVLTAEEIEGTAERVPHSYGPLARDVEPGDRILLDDGRLELSVKETDDKDEVRCEVVAGGELSDRKGMNLPGVKLSTAALTDKDRADLAFGVELGVDYVAISFVRRPEDVAEAKALAGDTPVIAKIEKPEAVESFDRILEQADGIMVARGDLGVEMGPERVPLIQKQLIEQTNHAGKVVITATEMLDSMRWNPRPTRAEASDVANAILDGTDAVMLSGETAAGDYPVQAVETMGRIICEIESSSRFMDLPDPPSVRQRETTAAMARAAVVASKELGADRILCYTESGATAHLISEYRPRAVILAVTATPLVYRRLAIHWGVRPLLVDHTPSTDKTIKQMTEAALGAGLVEPGEVVVLTMGSRQHGASDLMKIHRIGE